MTTYDRYGPHGSGSGPIWIVNAPAADYPDGRFDGVTPPLDPQQPPEEARVRSSVELTEAVIIADQARHAAPDIETVFRLYGHIQTHPLPNLRALLDMLTPPAPKWTAAEEEDE